MSLEPREELLYHNREISWLRFNQRVLEQAGDTSIPLLERLKFLSIFTNNLDEFFMIRVGSLTDRENHDPDALDNKSGWTARQQLDHIFSEVRQLVTRKDKTALALRADLALGGVTQLLMNNLEPQQQDHLQLYYHSDIQPLLSPQIIDKHHPFPFLQNKATYICVQLKTKGEFVKLGVVPLPSGISRVLFLPGEQKKFVLLEDVLFHYCDTIFPGYQVVDKAIFRITRNADITVDEGMYDQELDYRSVMEEVVRNRRRLLPVRLELQYCTGGPMVEELRKKLELTPRRVFSSETPMDMTFGFGLYDKLERQGGKALTYTHLSPQQPAMLTPKTSLIQKVLEQDVLLSFPFESITPFLHLLNEAAMDDAVISIKMTLYRVARQSQVIAALVKAAENGKEVSVVVELRARFDEENNIVWSRRLEEAGVQVIYGLGQYKVHSKLLVITRKHNDEIQFITQVGTGNYNESTAKLYTDLSLITANKAFGQEGVRIFNGILTDTPVTYTEHLLAAPSTMKNQVLSLIKREMSFARLGQPALIQLKVNSVTDKDIIDALIDASQAGVSIRMIVRGICCLRAGVPGKTDNIQVISIVGRFLEHSRIYAFGTPQRRILYISSADLMTRNMERRVEVAAPIYDPRIQERLLEMLELHYRDNVKAKRLLPDGTYEPVKNDYPPCDSQIDLYKLAYETAHKLSAPVSTSPSATISTQCSGKAKVRLSAHKVANLPSVPPSTSRTSASAASRDRSRTSASPVSGAFTASPPAMPTASPTPQRRRNVGALPRRRKKSFLDKIKKLWR